MSIWNCHVHVFTDKAVPKGFLPAGLVPILRTKAGYYLLVKLLKNVNPFTNKDSMNKMAEFIRLGHLGSQKAIFNECARFYPENTKFIVLPMDMAYMGAGDPKQKYIDQLFELSMIAYENPNVIPFFMADPRNAEVSQLFNRFIHGSFKGVKIYPPLGYYPYDERLTPIYEYCNENSIPVLSHCTPGNPVHFKGSMRELRKMAGVTDKKLKRGEICDMFTNPDNWEQVAQKYPNINICLAHAGGANMWDKWFEDQKNPENWLNKLIRLAKAYGNIYFDISFTMADTKYFALLKILLTDTQLAKKILFGSDFYMVQTESTENVFAITLRAYLGEYMWKMITDTNPRRYLQHIYTT